METTTRVTHSCLEAGPRPGSAVGSAAALRAIAFYLPQFHPIPENDQWWGRGFTEWSNVAQCRPRFRGHDQPHLPADLGFYDLRLPETRQAQAALAARSGISAFCYYHYWFSGRRLLGRPFEEVLTSGKPDFPFCLCWANQNWTRSWDGHEREILVAQEYSPADDRRHIDWLLKAFRDPRYLRVEGRPLFLVYKASELPAVATTLRLWREAARAAGLGELFLARVESGEEDSGDPRPLGFDAGVEFQPRWQLAFGAAYGRRIIYRVARRLRLLSPAHCRNSVLDYAGYVKTVMREPAAAYPLCKAVCPSWDNSARRARGAFIFTGAEPRLYEQWLRWAATSVPPIGQERLLFINAWNEWAEGTHLEPCRRWGHGFLEATRRALDAAIDTPA